MIRGHLPPRDLTGQPIDRRRGNRTGMHIQSHTRTLNHHWGPHVCGSTGQDHPGAGLAIGIAGLAFIPEATIPALLVVGGFDTGLAGATYQYGCDIKGC